MKIRKIISYLVVCAMVISLFGIVLTGCGTGTGTTETTLATTEGTGETTAPDTGTRYSFKFHTWYEDMAVTSDIGKLISDKVGADITFQWISWVEYGTKLNILNMSNNLPDTLISCGCAKGEVWRNVSATITAPDLKANMPNYWKRFVEMNGNSEEDATFFLNSRFNDGVTGRVIGIPQGIIEYGIPFATAWRMDIVEDILGMKMPTNLTEVEAIFKAYITKYPGKYPVYKVWNFIGKLCYLAYGIDCSGSWLYDTTTNKLVNVQETPAYKLVITRLANWTKLGYINPEYITIKETGADRALWLSGAVDQGEIVNEMLSFWSFNSLNPDGDEALMKKNVPTARIGTQGPLTLEPDAFKGVYKHPEYVWGAMAGWTSKVSISSSKEKDPARFAKLLSCLDTICFDKPTFMLARYGIEGTNYDVNPDGTPKAKDKYSFATAEGAIAKRAEGIDGSAWCTDLSLDIWAFDLLGPNYKKAWDDFVGLYSYDVATYKKDFQFEAWGPNITMGTETFPEYDLMKVAFHDFITGIRPMSEYDKWLADLKTAGLDKWTAAANSQELGYFQKGLFGKFLDK